MGIFDSIKLPKINSNVFNLSHDIKMSFDMGELVPTAVMEVVPGDKFEISCENMLRFAPLVSPVMHKIKVDTHYYFVPNRILWPNWEKWITGDLEVQAPFINSLFSIEPGTIGDYLGYNKMNVGGYNMSPLAVAGYFKIYDEFYRDQNLIDEKFEELVDGNNNTPYQAIIQGEPLKRAWRHDYFTSALPFAQKGAEVTVPLIDGTLEVEVVSGWTGSGRFLASSTQTPTSGTAGGATTTGQLEVGGTPAQYDPMGSLEADPNAEAVSLNTLRRAFRLQEWLERNARGGTRYIENVLAHFGVKSSDQRMHRPEYIGGSKQNMIISEVLSTAQTDPSGTQEIPVGYMAGHGISVGGGNTFNYRAEEHGWIIGIISVMPDTSYMDGINKMHRRFDRLDYYWPSFAHIGEQPIELGELWSKSFTLDDYTETFGYIPRYSEYKYIPSRVAGLMKSDLKFWHLSREFATKPALNETFIECNPDKRIFAIEDENEDTIYAHIYNNVKAIRKMPVFGTPKM